MTFVTFFGEIAGLDLKTVWFIQAQVPTQINK